MNSSDKSVNIVSCLLSFFSISQEFVDTTLIFLILDERYIVYLIKF